MGREDQKHRHLLEDTAMLEYERMKKEWVKNNPKATPGEYQKAMVKIVKELRL